MASLTLHQKVLHQQFSRYGRNAKEWMKKCALMLPEIDREKIWQTLKFKSIYHYAAVVAGMSKHQAESALWTVRKIEDKPELLKVAQEKGIHAVRPVANVATMETEAFWAEKARSMTKSTLEIYVRQAGLTRKRCPGTTLQPENPTDETITLSLPSKLARRLDRLRKREDFSKLMETFMDSIEAQEEETKPQAVESVSHYIPVSIKRYATTRTGNKCAFPGCDRPIHQLHHTERFALTKRHDPNTLAPLCKAHNELAHLGLIEHEESPSFEWKLRNEADQRHPKWNIDQKVQQRWQARQRAG